MVCLPHDPRRDRFDREASTLHDLVSAGDFDAIAAVAAVTDAPGDPQTPDPVTFALDDARAVIARRYGFADWARLSAYLDVVDVYRRDNLPDAPVDSVAGEFCRAATLTYSDDDPERLGSARTLLTAHPELTHDDIWAAAAAADVAAVTRLLAADPVAGRPRRRSASLAAAVLPDLLAPRPVRQRARCHGGRPAAPRGRSRPQHRLPLGRHADAVHRVDRCLRRR